MTENTRAAPALPPVPEVEALVTQADREAAAAVAAKIDAQLNAAGFDATYNPPGDDSGNLVQAFARHRAAALQSQAAECARLREALAKCEAQFLFMGKMLAETTSVKRDGEGRPIATWKVIVESCGKSAEFVRQALGQEPTK